MVLPSKADGAMIYAMGRDPAKQATPDLFSTETVRDAPSPPTKPISATARIAEPASPRHVLPKNLPHAVKQLSDDELDRLFEAAFDEAKCRGRLPPSVGVDFSPSPRLTTDLTTKRVPRTDDRKKVGIADVSLTRGRVNAVRSAFKAGVTPSRIARQFGISQANVRKALESDDRKR
jgi:hypothetical protein